MTIRENLAGLVRENPSITAAEAARKLGVSRQRVHQLLFALGMRLRDGRIKDTLDSKPPQPSPPHYDDRRSRLPPYLAAGINELRVSMDLLGKGFDVFRPLIGYSRCDAVAISRATGKVYKVEVKSAWRTETGRACYNKGDKNDFDVLAMVFRDGSIEYLPEEPVA